MRTLESGSDVLLSVENVSAGAGDDELGGHHGDDVLIGGFGNDWRRGDRGSDTFVFAPGSVNDIVQKFDDARHRQDVLDITPFGITAADFAARVAIDSRARLRPYRSARVPKRSY